MCGSISFSLAIDWACGIREAYTSDNSSTVRCADDRHHFFTVQIEKFAYPFIDGDIFRSGVEIWVINLKVFLKLTVQLKTLCKLLYYGKHIFIIITILESKFWKIKKFIL